MSRLAVFGYGSLVDPRSLGETLGEEPAIVAPATLRGWRRTWTLVRDNLACEKTFARADSGELPPFVVGLNIEPDDEAATNGALLELSEPVLKRLDLRELRYDRVNVTDQIGAAESFDVVFTYRAKREHFAASPPPGAVILASYVETVEAAFNDLGMSELKRFRESTGPLPVEVIEAVLVEDAIPPGNPREW